MKSCFTSFQTEKKDGLRGNLGRYVDLCYICFHLKRVVTVDNRLFTQANDKRLFMYTNRGQAIPAQWGGCSAMASGRACALPVSGDLAGVRGQEPRPTRTRISASFIPGGICHADREIGWQRHLSARVISRDVIYWHVKLRGGGDKTQGTRLRFNFHYHGATRLCLALLSQGCPSHESCFRCVTWSTQFCLCTYLSDSHPVDIKDHSDENVSIYAYAEANTHAEYIYTYT